MTFFGALMLMLVMHWQLALVTLAIVPVVTWLAAVCGSRLQASGGASASMG